MKKLIFVLFFIPMMGFGQLKEINLISLWDSYIVYCNTLVADTVLQEGIVSLKYKPVMNGKLISHFIIAPIDTVWKDAKCMDYRYYSDYRSLSDRFSVGGDFGIISYNNSYTLAASVPSYTYSPIEQTTQKITITRKKICMIKKRQASWEDFWNRWLKENGVIEFN